ncbi:hypothetical protein Glove_79g105 [Diversispora epigaea]|uniref:Protein kinase domain-containing protein n=1 Tax=Diversispora epigaea TaxID=1348612 RepID=A0A397J8G0_9GLOM|nr:hypothetical protein Glove_79g105 [Diversispora epigaea]
MEQNTTSNLNEVVNEIDSNEFEEDYGILETKMLMQSFKRGFGKVYSAIWKEGPITLWDIRKNLWERSGNYRVALKSLNNSQNITTEFLNEFKNFLKFKYPLIVPFFEYYTRSRDEELYVYDFAMIMFEILTGIPPFYNIPHDIDLVLKFCNGYRPEIPSHIAIPQLLDAKSEQRPTSEELGSFYDYRRIIEDEVRESEIYRQIEECNRLNLTNPVNGNNTNSSTPYEIHPSAIYTSRCFNFENLPKPKNLNENDTTKDYQITEEFSIEIT